MEIPKNDWKADGMLSYVIQIYIIGRLSILSNHYQLVTMEPVSVSASRWHVYRLTPPNKTVSNADLERSRKDVAFVKDAGFEEDREAACSIKRGLMGGGNTHFTFGRFEKEIVHFHRQLSVPINQLSN